MAHVRVTHATSAAPALCWELMADFANIDYFNPHLSESRLLEGSPANGLGTTRHCDIKGGKNYIRERVVDWQEGRSYTVDIYDGTMPVTGMMTTLGLSPRPGGGSHLFMETSYTPRYGIVGKAMDVLAMRRMFSRMLLDVIKGLAEKAEARAATGQIAAE
jgi:hypothetical protein